MNLVYSTVIAVCVTSFRVLRWDVRVRGETNVPESGGGVVATNHISYLDFVFAGYGARAHGGRRLRFLAKREIFEHPVGGPLMRRMGHIAVDRGGDTTAALREATAALAGGDLVGMFPEGTISTSFVPLAGRPGAAKMAMDADVPLIPGAVWGTQRIFTKGRRMEPAIGTVVTVTFGPPVPYERGEKPLVVHQRLMAAIGELVSDAQRSYPQRPGGAGDSWWLPAHLGGTAPTVEQAQQRAERDASERRARRAADRRARRPGAA